MNFLYIFLLSVCFSSTYNVGDQISLAHQNAEHDICYGSEEHDFGSDGTLSFSDFNGSNSNFHVFFIDLAASW